MSNLTYLTSCSRRIHSAGLGLIAISSPFLFNFGCSARPEVLLGSAAAGSDKSILPQALAVEMDEFPDVSVNQDADVSNDPSISDGPDSVCAGVGAILHGFHRLMDGGLGMGAALRDDLEDPSNPHLEETINVDGEEVAYKADFSPFDIDGDGVDEGSGRADTTPVAVRLWIVNDTGPERFICAMITDRPSRRGAGSGDLYVQPGVVRTAVNPEFRVHVTWDRTDPAHRWHEAHTVGRLLDHDASDLGHHRIEMNRLDDGSIEMTLRSTASVDSSEFEFSQIQFVGRTIRGLGAARINAVTTGESSVALTDDCVSVPGCSTLDGAECAAIRTDEFDYLTPSAGAETDWPAAFPAEPTL